MSLLKGNQILTTSNAILLAIYSIFSMYMAVRKRIERLLFLIELLEYHEVYL
jgi:hypothetical protein